MTAGTSARGGLWRTFGPDVWRHWRAFAVGYLLDLVSVGAALAAPWPLKIIIDQVLSGHSYPAWVRWIVPAATPETAVVMLAGLFVLAVATGVVAVATQRVVSARVRERLTVELRDRVVAHLQTLPPTIRTSYRSGDLVLRLVGDIDIMVRLLTKNAPLIFRFTATAVFTLAAMAWVAPRVGLLGLLLMPGFFLLVRYYGPRLTAAARRKRKREGEVASFAQEIVRGLAVTQALGASRHVRDRFGALNAASLRAGVQETRVGAAMERALELARAVAIALVTAGGAWLVLRGRLTVGELTVLAAYTTQLLKPVDKVNELGEAASRGLAGADRLLGLLALAPVVRDAPGAIEIGRARGRLELRDVWFAYPDEHGRSLPVLTGASVTIEPGRLTVLLGRSGAGKSTLLSLLVRIFDPSSGEILLDGRPIPQITLASLRAQVAIMAQDLHLFAGTLRQALAPAETTVSDGKLWEALALVAMDDFVRGLPDQLDTLIGEDGLNLSGGQRQRLTLARAFLLDRPILLLDEPLANVDAVSGQIILDALDALRATRTCLAITHQPELMAYADAVYRIEGGRLIAQPRDAGLALAEAGRR